MHCCRCVLETVVGVLGGETGNFRFCVETSAVVVVVFDAGCSSMVLIPVCDKLVV